MLLYRIAASDAKGHRFILATEETNINDLLEAGESVAETFDAEGYLGGDLVVADDVCLPLDDGTGRFRWKGAIVLFEARLIRRALDAAGGAVTEASRLLGFNHHQSLLAMLKGRHKSLRVARTPERDRRMPLHKQHRKKKTKAMQKD